MDPEETEEELETASQEDPEPEEADEVEVPEGAKDPDAVRNAIKAERKRARDANARARELERELAARDEAQKPLEDRVSEAQRRAEEAERRAQRLEVAAEKGLPLKLANRLTGSTREEMLADADELLALVGERAAEDKPAGSMDGGFRDGPPPATDPEKGHNALIGAILNAHRSA